MTTTPPIKNWPLIWKTYDHIVENPKEWNQSEYAIKSPCGTAACFAGTAVLIDDPTAVFSWSHPDEEGVQIAVCIGGESISGVAQEALGLNGWEADLLFNCINTLEDITRLLRTWEAADG